MGTNGPDLDLWQKTGRKNTAKGGEHRALGSRAEDGFIKKAGALLKWRPPGEGGCQQNSAGIRREKRWTKTSEKYVGQRKDVRTKAREVDADAGLERCHESRDDAGSKSNGGFGHAPQVKKLLPRPTSPRCGAESDGEL
ncbi:hypothetical protein E4U19_004269 [Claviceps sp. Clav32 group G5]|nr:hypothetical protein E4U19_004269 [Claviceps sp. Clav32 group G5]KAG6028706.1 hypothetical protein E4U40_000881 [Claviceps sp. LM458 group G5]KAG6043713.1 hypothetical protein E4U39_004231 [Claviceps sp. Clav50 group G5]